MLLNRIKPEIDTILRKNENGFRTNRSTTGQIMTIRRILEGVKSKNLPLTIIFIDFSKAFNTINRKKMKEILLKYGIPEETVCAIMMLHQMEIHLTLKSQLESYKVIHLRRSSL